MAFNGRLVPSGEIPDGSPHWQDVVRMGLLTMYLTVFLALVGQGTPPREAVAVTITLAMGSVEVLRRLPRDFRNGSGGTKWV